MLPGEVVAERFKLEHLAQVGGMGALYQARDRITGRTVAVKLLRAPGGVHDQRFLREAALLSELRHPAIVRHIAHGRTPEGELYMAMEWLEGEDLSRRLHRGPLDAGEAIDLIRRTADALAVLHERGGVHRDLKPANLFLEDGRADRVKLLDFGIARVAAALQVTSTGTVLGTPGYTAPEQARGAGDVDARADVFALGCVLFECLTGQPAFRGEHVMAVLAKVLLEDPPRLTDVAPDAPPALEALVARLLSKDPDRRPRDGAEVRDVLDAIQRGSPGLRLVGPLTPRPISLGSDEQRFMCLALCTLDRDDEVEGGRPRPAPTVTSPLGSEPTLVPDALMSHDALAALCRSHGTRLEPLVDGSWVALADRGTVRAPATDQAGQIARVALALSRAMPTAKVSVAAGRGIQAGRAPVGEVIDRALTLVRGAPRGTVSIDGLVAGLLGGGFELRDDHGVLRLLAENGEAAPARRVLGRPTPCVGRDRELSTLVQLFDEVVTEPCARAVLIRAPAGHGKSRLRQELYARLRARGIAFEWLYGKGEPLHAGSPFAMASQVVRRAAGVVDGEPVETRRGRLAERVAQAVAPADRERITSFLGELAHVPTDLAEATPVASARRDAVIMGDQLRRAWDDWLDAETARRPVVLVLEDLHLGDLSTVKLVDSALRNLRERPLMVLALARPEIDQLFPGLWAERGLATLPLAELSRKVSTRLVREILGEQAAADKVARIVEQAGGNAFYLEELCRVVQDGPSVELPGTVLAMAQARLEAVDAETRRFLRAASVFGDRFPRGGALALWGEPGQGAAIDRLLADVVERELCEPTLSEVANEPTYGFRHALVREAAYAMLTDRDRELGHRLAATWLTAAGVDDPVLLAEHFERGGVPSKAVAGYLRAARDALEGNDLVAVLARVERALACGADGDERGELLALRAEAHRWRADYPAAIEAAGLAMAALPPGGRGWCVAATQAIIALSSLSAHDGLDALLTRCTEAPPLDPVERLRTLAKGCVQLYLTGRYPRADALLTAIDLELNVGEPIDEPLLDARVHEAHAFAEGARAEQGRALELLELVAAAYQRAGDLRGACMAENNLGYTFVQLGDYARAATLLERALRDAERMGQPHIAKVAQQNLGLALSCLGDHERAAEAQTDALASFLRQHDVHMAAVSRTYLAQQLIRTGALEAAEREAQQAIDAVAENPPSLALALATLAHARSRRGDPAGALEPARQAAAILDALGGLDEGELLVRLALVEALVGSDRRDEARVAAAIAIGRIETLAATLPSGLREHFVDDVAENAAIRRLAVELGAS